MSRYTRQETPVEEDSLFEKAVDAMLDAYNRFGQLRRWGLPAAGASAADEGLLRCAAKEFRDACDRVAEMPQWTPDGRRAGTGAEFEKKRGFISLLMLDAAAFNEPWLQELARRMADRIVTTHRDQFFDSEHGGAP